MTGTFRGSLPFSLCVCLYSSSPHLALHHHLCFSSVSDSPCPFRLSSRAPVLMSTCILSCVHTCVSLSASLRVCVCMHLFLCVNASPAFLRMKVPAQHFELTDLPQMLTAHNSEPHSVLPSSQPQGLPRLQAQVGFFSMTHQALCNLSIKVGQPHILHHHMDGTIWLRKYIFSKVHFPSFPQKLTLKESSR